MQGWRRVHKLRNLLQKLGDMLAHVCVALLTGAECGHAMSCGTRACAAPVTLN